MIKCFFKEKIDIYVFVSDKTIEYEKNKLELTRSDTRYNNLKQENTFKRKKRDNSPLISH